MTPLSARRRTPAWTQLPVSVLAVATALTAAAQDASMPVAREQTLETSDGIRFAAWYYPTPADIRPAATVIIIHDIGGSHATVETLATSLQRAGYAVVAPDLRGHRHGPQLTGEGGSGKKADPADVTRALRKSDFDAIAASRGRVRDDLTSSQRGEIEAVRAWIKQQSDSGKLDIEQLCVVGSGLGATLAAMWTAADWDWPPTTAGPQGRQVRALVLVSPAMSSRGLSMTAPLASEAIRTSIPVMVVAGAGESSAARLFDQFKRFRPTEWLHKRDGQEPERGTGKLPKEAERRRKGISTPTGAAPAETIPADGVTAFFFQCSTNRSGDDLATDTTIAVPDLVKQFISRSLARKRD